MAELVLNDVVDRLVTKAFSLTTKDIISKWGFKEELKDLFDTLYNIKVVLHQKRQVSDVSVMNWLMGLRNVSYEIDNVLDKFNYEIIQQKVQLQNQMIDQGHRFSSYYHDKIKTIKQSLDNLVNDVVGFGLRMELLKSIIKVSLDKNEDSFLNDSEVVERGFDVTEIVNKLIISSSNQQVISVLPIVGMAGLGKTTLAKVLYNHKEIKKHFDVLPWVHASEIFDVKEMICESLKIDSTRRKKYFLVLDDIQIEDRDKWDILRSCWVGINSSIRINIIVTTRSDKVAQIMGTLPPHHLKKLSDTGCWLILEKRVLADKRKSLTFGLEVRGREIAKRCIGVPLVARVLGEAMYFKCDENEWLAIQDDKIWYLLDDGNSDIYSALKLYFDHLPALSLKQCFAYCAIFPKDYDMIKDEVIQYWMAEGFLKPTEEANMAMEDIGNMYFNILLATSFFKNARKDAYGNIISCKMHDLVHDFALSISKSETLILERDSMDDISNVQCLFVQSDGKATLGTAVSGDGFIKLNTLMSKNVYIENTLSNFKFLRVLKLSGLSIMWLSDSIEQLIHLRLLHISYKIKELPKSITKLYNLQTLRIEECLPLMKLPEDLSNLVKLRHIHINHTTDYGSIMQTPKNMGWLTCLQTLSFFVVGPDEGYQIKELGFLKNLRGEIDIRNLEKVEDEEEAKTAKLKEKEIFKLGLYWQALCMREYNKYDKNEKVLEGLQPHPNLKSLTIHEYMGKKFPSWVGLSLYHNLIEIKLIECRRCEEVPTLGHLPCLRFLEIFAMRKVKRIGSEFYHDGNYINTTLFPALKVLKLQCMSSLEDWKDASEVLVFPCLEEFTIKWCDSLGYLPNSLHTCISLRKLVVEFCKELRYLPGVPLQCYTTSIEYMENRDCMPSTSSIQPSLQKLHLCLRGKPHSLQVLNQIQYFIALKILWIEDSDEMVALPEWLGNLSSLQKLYIKHCDNLVHLPTEEAMRRLTQLEMLTIYGCPKFKEDEKIKISHVPRVEIIRGKSTHTIY